MTNLGKLRFFFDWSAGGCLCAGNDQTLDVLDYGPVDADCFNLEGRVHGAITTSPSSLVKLVPDTTSSNENTASDGQHNATPFLVQTIGSSAKPRIILEHCGTCHIQSYGE